MAAPQFFSPARLLLPAPATNGKHSVALDPAPNAADDPLEPIRRLVLEAVSSPLTRRSYAQALKEFFRWRAAAGNPSFTRAAVHAWRAALDREGYAPSTI